MKKNQTLINLIFILFTASFSKAAIYGSDDRKDINQVPFLRSQAQAVAASIPLNFLKQNPDGSYQLTNAEPLSGSSSANACKDERFANQPTVSNCTGFLIGDQHLLTAGHCLLPNGIINQDKDHAFCESFGWYFDYNLNIFGQYNVSRVPKDKIYHCVKVLRAENIDHTDNTHADHENDFAILELDRPVPKGIPRLKYSFEPVQKGDSVYTLGHPWGLPLKYSGRSGVLHAENPFYFEVNLDTLGGNSGGPVFNQKNQVVGILISGHNVDSYDGPGLCQKVNRCDSTGRNCTENSKFRFLPVTNHVQKLAPLKKYLFDSM